MRKKKFQFRSDTEQLQLKSVSWYLALRVLPATGKKERIFLLLLLDQTDGKLLRNEFFQESVSPRKLLRTLEEVMHTPLADTSEQPFRPSAIEFEQEEISSELEPYLSKIGISTRYHPLPQLADEAITQVIGELVNQIGELDLLNIPGITHDLARDFYKTSAELFRLQPWTVLDDSQPLEINFQPDAESFFTFILGQGDDQPGLMFFNQWEDLLAVMAGSEDPSGVHPSHSVLTLYYETRQNMSPGDLKAIQAYDWEIASEIAYPNARLYTKDEILSPSLDQLNRQIAALKGIIRFLQEDLQVGEDGDFSPVEVTCEFEMNQAPIKIDIRYPAQKIQEIKASHDYGLIHADLPHVQASLKLADQAWHMDDPQERVHLAKEALSKWEDCIQAYNILGEEAENMEEALEYFEKGVSAGERSLDMAKIELYVGPVWDIHAYKHFLIALQGVVECLVEMEDYESAVSPANTILQRNPADHQGMRYTLLFILTQLKRDSSLRELLDRYPDDISAVWPYSRALLEFRQKGENRKSRLLLKEAFEVNPYIPDFLTGKRPIPEELPDYVSFGDEHEAMYYARDYYTAWWQTKGAISWLQNNLKSLGYLGY